MKKLILLALLSLAINSTQAADTLKNDDEIYIKSSGNNRYLRHGGKAKKEIIGEIPHARAKWTYTDKNIVNLNDQKNKDTKWKIYKESGSGPIKYNENIKILFEEVLLTVKFFGFKKSVITPHYLTTENNNVTIKLIGKIKSIIDGKMQEQNITPIFWKIISTEGKSGKVQYGDKFYLQLSENGNKKIIGKEGQHITNDENRTGYWNSVSYKNPTSKDWKTWTFVK